MSFNFLVLCFITTFASGWSLLPLSNNETPYDENHPFLSVTHPKGIDSLQRSDIRPGIRAYQVTANTSIGLKCTGSRELAWSLPENHVVSRKMTMTMTFTKHTLQDEQDAIAKWANITHSCSTSEDGTKTCISQVFMPHVFVEHTGYYSCFYNGSQNPRRHLITNDHPEKFQKGLLKSSVFFFVKEDEEYLLIPHDNMRGMLVMSVVSGYPVTIPCIPPDPSINITLWKTGNMSHYEKVNIDSDLGITFDPTMGFSFQQINWHPEMAQLQCRARNLKGEEETCHVIIHWSFDPGNLHPVILDKDASWVTVNSSFSLTCRVETLAGAVITGIKWSHPITNESRVEEELTKEGGSYLNDDPHRPIAKEVTSKKLIVTDAQLSDAGLYNCTVTSLTEKSYVASYKLKVHLSPQPPPLATTDLGYEAKSNSVFPSSRTVAVVSISITAAVITTLFIFAMTIFCMKYKTSDHQISKSEVSLGAKRLPVVGINHAYGDLSALINPDLPLYEQIDLLPYDKRYEFPRDRLALGKTLGQGAFGRVVQAKAIGIIQEESSSVVAVKMLKERADPEQKKALFAELKILIHLGRNLNIVNLLGACTVGNGELLVIVEYCKYGNLRQFLIDHRNQFIDQVNPLTGEIDANVQTRPNSKNNSRKLVVSASYKSLPSSTTSHYDIPSIKYSSLAFSPDVDSQEACIVEIISDNNNKQSKEPSCNTTGQTGEKEDIIIKTRDLICFAWQVSRGMEYLASRKLIHRDLAARNVLLSDGYVVKICDFGLAKNCYKTDEYVKKGDGPLPIKWMALESMRDKVFNVKSDVWSFAILCWEFFTLGETPYPGMEADHSFYNRIKQGFRMEKPPYCPQTFFDNIISQCWQEDPESRPSFHGLCELLGKELESSITDYYVQMNVIYDQFNAPPFGPEHYTNVCHTMEYENC